MRTGKAFPGRSLTAKLLSAVLLVSLLSVGLVAFFARWTNTQAFDELVQQQSLDTFIGDVTTYYQRQRSWAGVAAYFHNLRAAPVAPPPRPGQPPPPAPIQAPLPYLLIDTTYQVLLNIPPYELGQRVPDPLRQRAIPIFSGGETIAFVVVMGNPSAERSANEARFLARTNQAVLYGALAAVLFSFALGLVLARTLTRPLRHLTQATQNLVHGRGETQVAVTTQDEIGELATAFNQMSHDLAQSQQLRRQMTADIAHDLRTPLAVIGGYLESFRDGVLPATTERLDIVYQEVQHLQHLVEDLRTLSLADAQELPLTLAPISPHTLLLRMASSYAQTAQAQEVALHLNAAPTLPPITVDQERMVQVLGNLLSNALRFAPAGGTITLSAVVEGDTLLLRVADNGPGIPPAALPHIFERFYRADTARNLEVGESGLGLAIAKSIVEAHDGRIWAEPLEPGVAFVVALPVGEGSIVNF